MKRFVVLKDMPVNPNRPDCLNGDYNRGCAQLAITYRNLFTSFLNFCEVMPERFPLVEQEPSPVKKKTKLEEQKKAKVEDDDKKALSKLGAPKAGHVAAAPSSGIMKYFNPLPGSAAVAGESRKRAASPPPSKGVASPPTKRATSPVADDKPKRGWAFVLQEMALAPERFADAVVFKNERIVAVKDKFPKSSVHVLIMPR
jgi:aprataxin